MILKLYQLRGRDFLLRHKRALVVMPTGSGKSEVVLLLLRKLRQPAWVVCPKSLVGQWQKHVADLPEVRIFSFPTVQYHIELLDSLERPEIIVIDEPKPLKSNTAVFENMLKYNIRAPRRIILDATPLENHLEELWFLFRWLAPKVLGPYEDFLAQHVTGAGRYRGMRELRVKVADHVFRPKVGAPRDRKLMFIPVVPDFPAEVAREHEELCRRLTNSLKASAKSGSFSALNRSRGLISKLRSFLGDPTRGASAKIDELRVFLLQHSDRRGIIFVYKRETAKLLKEALNADGHAAEVFDGSLSAKRREELKDRFNKGSLRFLVATSAGERGMDLPTGNLVVHFDLLWTRASYDQRDRVSRLSSERAPAWIVTFILKGTVDEVLWSIISSKQKLMLAPFAGDSDELVINKYSWQRFLKERLEVTNGPVDEETGEGVWFSRGKRL
jgi:hypothetical protein